ncbi:MAG: hypothetical protein E4H24_06335, partial [Thermomicrobiales bacterium]
MAIAPTLPPTISLAAGSRRSIRPAALAIPPEPGFGGVGAPGSTGSVIVRAPLRWPSITSGLSADGRQASLLDRTDGEKMASVIDSAVGLVLAAGGGSRFGGGKMLARVGGRPILQRVLDALSAAGIEDVVVVLGTDAEAIEPMIAWRAERRVVNPEPEHGLSSSLRVG